MSMRHLYVLAALLSMLGLSVFWYKATILGLPLAPQIETPVWTVEARISFWPGQGSVKVRFPIPNSPPGFSVFEENFVSRGYGLTTQEKGGNRTAQWAIRRASGVQTLYYRVTLYQDPKQAMVASPPEFPEVPEMGEPYDTAMQSLIAEVRRHSADVATFTAELLKQLNAGSPDEDVALFVSKSTSPIERAEIAGTLLAGARIPALIVQGVFLEDKQRRTEIVPWLAVHNGDEWLYFDPITGDQGLPPNFLIWSQGTAPLVRAKKANQIDLEIAAQRNQVDAMLVAERRAELRESGLMQFSLTNLPIRTQTVYRVLLLIPIGTLVIVILRNLVGVKTFGTFMPVLIALAFRETQLVNGVILFSVLVALGLAIRFYLEKLRLLLVPRLSCVLIIVVLLMVTVSVVSHRMGLEPGLSVALFPMVILTMVIERMSIVWEERGSTEALQDGVGSLVTAALAYSAMSFQSLGHLVFVFPELLLVFLAITLILGRYTGYRLFELVRFKAIGQG